MDDERLRQVRAAGDLVDVGLSDAVDIQLLGRGLGADADVAVGFDHEGVLGAPGKLDVKDIRAGVAADLPGAKDSIILI